jgi:hypothetical protein
MLVRAIVCLHLSVRRLSFCSHNIVDVTPTLKGFDCSFKRRTTGCYLGAIPLKLVMLVTGTFEAACEQSKMGLCGVFRK